MIPTRTILGLAILALILAGIRILRDQEAMSEFQNQLTADRSRESHLNELQRKYEELERENAKTAAALQAARQTASDASAVQPLAVLPSMDDMRKDPQYAAAWRRDVKRKLQAKYAEGFASIGYSAEQASKLLDKLVDRREAELDATELAKARGLSPEETAAAVAQAVKSYDTDIQTTLGPADFALMQDAPKYLQFNAWFDTAVGVDLKAAGAPATSRQESTLAQAYLDFRKTGPGATLDPNGAPDPQTGLNPYFAALLDRFSPSLTPAQTQVMHAYFADQVTANQFSAKLRSGR